MKRQYLYVYVTRRPSGWGRHFGYSGVTNHPYLRDQQHQAKPWYPLVVKRHLIPIGRVPRFVALGLEYVLIKVTRPVYNVQHNTRNARRITPWQAKAHRLAQDAGRTPVRARVGQVVNTLPVLAVAVLAFYLWSGAR